MPEGCVRIIGEQVRRGVSEATELGVPVIDETRFKQILSGNI